MSLAGTLSLKHGKCDVRGIDHFFKFFQAFSSIHAPSVFDHRISHKAAFLDDPSHQKLFFARFRISKLHQITFFVHGLKITFFLRTKIGKVASELKILFA